MLPGWGQGVPLEERFSFCPHLTTGPSLVLILHGKVIWILVGLIINEADSIKKLFTIREWRNRFTRFISFSKIQIWYRRCTFLSSMEVQSSIIITICYSIIITILEEKQSVSKRCIRVWWYKKIGLMNISDWVL